MAVVNENKKAWLDQVKADAETLTKRRFEDGGVDMHREKEKLVNTQEGVTEGTPVRQAALINPSEPDLANFGGDAESSISGKNPKAPSNQNNTPNNQVSADGSADGKVSKSKAVKG